MTTRVPRTGPGTTPAIAAPPLGDHPKRSRMPLWLRVVLELFAGIVNAIA